MDNNFVSLSGVVKRDASAVTLADGVQLLEWALTVHNEECDRMDIFDCRCTNCDGIIDQLDGGVYEGEEMTIEGHLEKLTKTQNARVAGSFVEVRNSGVIVYVDAVVFDMENENE